MFFRVGTASGAIDRPPLICFRHHASAQTQGICSRRVVVEHGKLAALPIATLTSPLLHSKDVQAPDYPDRLLGDEARPICGGRNQPAHPERPLGGSAAGRCYNCGTSCR